jgi:hypothetical protein
MNGSKGEYRPILGPDGRPITIGRIVADPSQIPARPRWVHDPEAPTHESFPRYCAWRATKCRLRDITVPEQHLEELDESTHQFVGEVAELGELLIKNDVRTFYVPETRAKLLSEAGDVFFCGLWLLDAIRLNVFRAEEAPRPNAIQSDEELSFGRRVGDALGDLPADTEIDEESKRSILFVVASMSWQMCVNAGLLCNDYKKIRWQQTPQPRKDMANRVGNVLCQTAHLLAMGRFGVEDALARNIEKLDIRFPDGYVKPGGGIREGKGA